MGERKEPTPVPVGAIKPPPPTSPPPIPSIRDSARNSIAETELKAVIQYLKRIPVCVALKIPEALENGEHLK